MNSTHTLYHAGNPFGLYERFQTVATDRLDRVDQDDMTIDSSVSDPNSPLTPLRGSFSIGMANHGCQHCHLSWDSVASGYSECQDQQQAIRSLRQHLANVRLERQCHQSKLETIRLEHKHLGELLTQRSKDINSLQKDLGVLRNKCMDEVTQVKHIQCSQASVTRELEDLHEMLFHEAQSLVVKEKQKRMLLQASCDAARHELTACKGALARVEKSLRNVRHDVATRSSQLKKRQDILRRAQTELDFPHMLKVNVDPDVVSDFGVMVRDRRQPIKKLFAMPWLRACLAHDIQPCLRFGPKSRLSAQRVLEGLLSSTCELEECPFGFADESLAELIAFQSTASLWDRFLSPTVFSGCQACGRNVKDVDRSKILAYRFRPSSSDNWLCIDQSCCDRLRAVLSFYRFIHRIHNLSEPPKDFRGLYLEASRIRLQMFLCR